jgi:hypothetical protein
MLFSRVWPAGVLAFSLCACGSATPVGTTTTTSATLAKGSVGLVLGDACIRNEACESGFCDHPMGYCGAPGVCKERLSCAKWSSLYGSAVEQGSGGQCTLGGRDVEVPNECTPRVTPEEALKLRRSSTVEIVPDDAR